MSTLIPEPEHEHVDYASAEGLNAEGAEATIDREGDRRTWTFVAIGLVGLVALIAALVSVVALASGHDDAQPVAAAPVATHADDSATETAAAPTAAGAKGVDFEKFEKVDPTLPPVPAGAVKKFKVDVYQHVTQVSKDLAPTEVWSFAVNGTYHRGTGVSAPMVVKNLAPVDKELWLTQQEYYIGQPGQDADMAKMQAKQPDVIAFNGYANQYKDNPIDVKVGEKVRMYVLNAGPSIWSAFHVIGTVFDRTVIEGTVGHDAQTVDLAPSQGGWVEFTLDEEGGYPFVTHAFGDMVKGALGVLKTPNAPDAHGH
jgi:FtsP/CotA-like multicopper oxidase with cupredoxin domain